MKTFLPRKESGTVKVLRYQVRPIHCFNSPTWLGVDQSSKVSTSLKVWGRETLDHLESSKSGAAGAPFGSGSALMNFQSGSKFSLRPSAAGEAKGRRRARKARFFMMRLRAYGSRINGNVGRLAMSCERSGRSVNQLIASREKYIVSIGSALRCERAANRRNTLPKSTAFDFNNLPHRW